MCVCADKKQVLAAREAVRARYTLFIAAACGEAREVLRFSGGRLILVQTAVSKEAFRVEEARKTNKGTAARAVKCTSAC